MEAEQVTYRLYPNVQLGENVQIGDYVIIGHPPRGKGPGELPVVIGDNAVIRSHTVIYAAMMSASARASPLTTTVKSVTTYASGDTILSASTPLSKTAAG
jgi:acetyltransferase-like isoleucine patch superfamily enzyme